MKKYYYTNIAGCSGSGNTTVANNVGHKLIYTPKAKIWHKGSASIGGTNYNPNQA